MEKLGIVVVALNLFGRREIGFSLSFGFGCFVYLFLRWMWW